MAVRKRLGEMLVEAGVIDEVQLQAALGYQRRWGGKLGRALIDLRLTTEPQVVAALSRKFGYEVADVTALEHDLALDSALRLVPGDVAVAQSLLPIAADANTLTVAMGDPSNVATVDELAFRTGRRIKVMIAGEREIAAAARRLYFEVDAGNIAAAPPEDQSSELALEAPVDPFSAAPERAGEARRTVSAVPFDPLEPRRRSAGVAMQSASPSTAVRARDLQPTFTPPPMLIPLGSEARPGGPDPFAKPVPARGGRLVEDVEQPAAPRDAALADALQRLARGEETAVVKAAQLAAAVARLLVKRGLIDEAELREELAKK